MGEIEFQVNGLSPVGQLSPQTWMEEPGLKAVVAALTVEGTEIRYVGGCVRDSLVGRIVSDVDIATPEPPEKTLQRLEAAEIKAIPTGMAHGTITAVVSGKPFEITTLRKDVETDGRHAVVNFTDNWIEDAARRDFTINALSATVSGEIYDPFGGIDDLATGTIRFVGRAKERIEEDVLRILRFFRFYAYYGRSRPNQDALFACKQLSPNLVNLSGERLRTEFLKLLLAPEPVSALTYMREAVLKVVLPEVADLGLLRALVWLETSAIKYETVCPDALRRFTALLKGREVDHKVISDRFRLSNKQQARLGKLMSHEGDNILWNMTEDQCRKEIYLSSPSTVRDLILLNWAKEVSVQAKLPREETDGWVSLVELTENWVAPSFPLTGKDALDMGISAGPAMGKKLKKVEEWWLDGGCRESKEACLRVLKRL
ncbi:MAG: CCA tRNA nucleotidyltransferase [Alphaproteobacteria bacterium]|nr:CCA tRNA nucleotidyltransferase [Rhodospirillales bacterium]MCW9046200.1 CCA tRNA nucleotidyltransferase [Alphaproteobacteria bacterium]